MKGRWMVVFLALSVSACGTAAAAERPVAGLAWDPAPRTLRDASPWLLAGERASQDLPRARPGVLFIGDSITEWWRLYGSREWDQDFAPLDAYDDGVVGDTTSNLLFRLEDGSLDGISPRLVVVLIGTNNIPLGQSPAEIAEGVRAVLAVVHQRLPHSLLMLLGLLPRGTPGSHDRDVVEGVNDQLRATPGVTYLDPGAALLQSDGRFVAGVTLPDLLHPASTGYAILAAQLAPAIRQELSRA